MTLNEYSEKYEQIIIDNSRNIMEWVKDTNFNSPDSVSILESAIRVQLGKVCREENDLTKQFLNK